MAQLADDCFAFGGPLMRAERALALLAERVRPVAAEEPAALRLACGRILARDVVAARSVPPHDNAAVDGFAVRFEDLSVDGDTRLLIAGRAAAGHPLDLAVAPGTAVRVFTGAVMPRGADTVFMQEDARLEGGHVILPAGQKRGANRRLAGEDVATGALALAAGARLRPQEIGLAASLGLTHLPVRARLRVGVFSTGDELRESGTDAPPGAVFDANRHALMALLDQLGCEVEDHAILADNRIGVREALEHASARNDALVTSGGMSTGEEDHVRAAVESLGAIHFWRLAIRPGRPVALGQVRGTAFIGLPGNPVAMIVTFLRFARPVLLRLGGAARLDPPTYRVAAGFALRKKPGRREWLRAWLETGPAGERVAMRFARDGAGILSSLVRADGLVELAEDVTRVREGDMVDYLPFNEVAR